VPPLLLLAEIAGLFLALPWLAVAFARYCDVVNRITRRYRRGAPDA
jgi:hypothetical protein